MSTATPRNNPSEVSTVERAAPVMETTGNSSALTCLNQAIDGSRFTRDVLAEDWLRVSKGEFSKLCSGRFRLEMLDMLPEEIWEDWARRMEEHRERRGASREMVVMARAAHALIDAMAVVKRMAKINLLESGGGAR